MKKRLAELGGKFNALRQREKQLVAATVVLAIVMGGFSLWVEPAQLRAAALAKETGRKRSQIQAMEKEIAALDSRMQDPDAAVKAALADVRGQIAATDRVLREYDRNLVPAHRMPELLQALFSRHRGLKLVGLQTLPPEPLLPQAPPKASGRAEAKAPEPARPLAAGVVKHGIELRMAGGYLDLLGYLGELENLPQRLVWDRMALVSQYPRSELTLTVYTLSLDSAWMVM